MTAYQNTVKGASQPEPIAVVGMACRFPGGANTPSKLWDLIRDPHDISKAVPTDRFDAKGYFHAVGAHHGATDCQKAYFLEEDISHFDNTFFNIQSAEAEAVDPQQRLLMEVVYDSLCAAGQTLEGLRGSKTAVYVGLMCDDWAQMTNRDWELIPTYGATGQSRAIISNRISYFFDWHGPSMTIDTACSSSLVAVHQGVTAIRNGECSVAIAAGANLILSPGMWIAESKLHMLSPTGTSKMWDAAADGYARGEGVAAVVLKPLSAALRDGDHIECIVRESGVNQDGRTPGLTMPSNTAQADLIRDTYLRAGLNINDPKERPQFFHAHGTGTPAGDPQEAEAISNAFFTRSNVRDPLHVGSIKTVIGHTEGTAGLASLIGTAMAMKHGMIPPNLHFNNLSPRVAPYAANLRVPTTAIPWPQVGLNEPRRASINSFGFGGTNSHVILEFYNAVSVQETEKVNTPILSPLTFSAASHTALRSTLSDISAYLKSNPEVNMRDLAYTLQTRRSTLAYRKAVACGSIEDATQKIDELLADTADGGNALSPRHSDVSNPSILGVFTGQGAQWPRMGALLIESSPFAAKILDELDSALQSLPVKDRPDWTLKAQLTIEAPKSRVSEAEISQPLCTAVQIVLVELLRAAKIILKAVVGHSSGEIGAAYAAGFLSASDAIRVAYFRGIYSKLACADTEDRKKGAMMAVGTSYTDVEEFCALEDFAGRIQIAAYNSPTSITLSGDEDAIEEAIDIFKDEGRFARRLKVDTAYHSQHMKPCAEPYLASLVRYGYAVGNGNDIKWYSSVSGGQVITKAMVQDPQYWVDNMSNPVMFEPAVTRAIADAKYFDLAIEVGPHPALKVPCLDILENEIGARKPYTGLLARDKNDVEELASAFGYIWTHLGSESIDFDSFANIDFGGVRPKRTVPDLPSYAFDHSRSFYQVSRASGGHLHVHAPPHPLLGRRSVESETGEEVSWRNILREDEISWLRGHQLQGQTVFPGMGYVAMAIEAASALANTKKCIGTITLENCVIDRAIAFSNESSGMETKVTLRTSHSTDKELSGYMTCHSGLPFNSGSPLALNFSAKVIVAYHEARPDALPQVRADEMNLIETESERLYAQFTELGYNYTPPFAGVRSIRRKMAFATGEIVDTSGDDWEDQLIVHPGWLDSAIQTSFAAYCYPQDMRLWALHVPTAIGSIVVNPYFSSKGVDRLRQYEYQASVREALEVPVEADIDVFAGTGQTHPFIQFESIQLKPFAAPGPQDDAVLFTHFDYRVAVPDAVMLVESIDLMDSDRSAVLLAADRIGFYYLRQLYESITTSEWESTLAHYRHLINLAQALVQSVSDGKHPNVPQDALFDSPTFVRSLIAKYHDKVDIKILEAAGEHIVDEIRRGGSVLEHMMEDGLLDRFYEESAALQLHNELLGRVIAQLAHRHPRMRLFEVGAGTGGVTQKILPLLGKAFETYTYTDISAGFFSRVRGRFADFTDRIVFATFDMERPPVDQGFEEESYDIVVASNVLHATGKMDDMMANVRKLLRPGGYLVVLEIISNNFPSINAIMGGLPGWWAGAEVDVSRVEGPGLTLTQWNTLARRHGFSGIDTHTPVEHKQQAFSVFVAQAIDEWTISLRDPLNAVIPGVTTGSGYIYVIGGQSTAISQLSEDIRDLLAPKYPVIVSLKSVEALTNLTMPNGSSILSLVELEDQLLEKRSAVKLEALQKMCRVGQNILWVTKGSLGERPYSAMMLGLARVVRYEQPHLNFQILDFDALPGPSVVAETMARLEVGARAKKSGANLLWSLEPEVHYVRGRPLIPRLYPEGIPNRRYNTYRRAVTEQVNIRDTRVALEAGPGGRTMAPYITSPLRLPPAAVDSVEAIVTLQVEYSLMQIFKIANAGHFTLCAGTDLQTGKSLVALSDAFTESQSTTSAKLTIDASNKSDVPTLLATTAATLLSHSILSSAPRIGTVLVHEAEALLKNALSRAATSEGAHVVFTTADKEKAKADTSYILFDTKLPVRLAKTLLPRDISFFMNMSTESGNGSVIYQSLPRGATAASAADFIGTLPGAFPHADIDNIGILFKTAWSSSSLHRLSSAKAATIPLCDVALHDTAGSPLTVIDWKTTSTSAFMRPVDAGQIFRADGTYLLFGLSGELGQSLCAWMIGHGARNIVLSSRRPKVDPKKIKELEASGATVRVIAADLTNRESLRRCYRTISAEMPPVLGVANGAMVLEDTMFDNLEFASMDRSLMPKVDGSVLLDELFYDTPLEFFILFTSVANLIGNTGQSSYVMANQFMSALAAQRRNVRGVVGSDMAISSLQGLGYIEHARVDRDYFVKLGYRNMSEQDFHQLFAEAILAGRPGSNRSSQVATGLIPFRDRPTIHAQLRLDPKFTHFMLQDPRNLTNDVNGAGKAIAPRIRLAAVHSLGEAQKVVEGSFTDHLKRILIMPSTEEIDPQVSLIELGADSILAVDVRSWFLKELEVDVPVLQVLGAGETVAGLVKMAVGKIPTQVWDRTNLQGQDQNVGELIVSTSLKSPESSAQSDSSSNMFTEETCSPRTEPTPQLATTFGQVDLLKRLAHANQKMAESMEKTSSDTSLCRSVLETSSEHTEQMTFGQRRFWFLTHYVEDPTTFNIAYLGKLRGRVRVEDLAKAVEVVAQRHEALRTRFFWSGDQKVPMQGVRSKPLVRLETATIQSDAQAMKELDNMRDYVWDLGDWVPIRMRLLTLSESVHYIVIGTHHISLDGHSFSVLMLDIHQAYMNHTRPLQALPNTSQVRVYGQQQRAAYDKGKLQPAIDYFREMLPLEDLLRPINLFPFARTQIRPALDNYFTFKAKQRLEIQTTAKLKQLARGRRATGFHAYLGALQAMLFRFLPADTTDTLVIGMADANRMDKDSMASIGNFLNVLPLRFDRVPHQKFGDAIESARQRAHGALDHSSLPFDLLLDELAVPRSTKHAPVFQVFIDYRLIVKEHAEKSWAGMEIADEHWHTSRSGYDIAVEISEYPEGADITMHVQGALYDSRAAELLVKSYANVLTQVAEQGDRFDLDVLQRWATVDVKEGLTVGKGLPMKLEWPATVAQQIDMIIHQHTNSMALKDGYGRELTYAAMDERIESIAQALRKRLPSRTSHIVGVFQMPSADWICSLLAIHRIGAVYLPLDLRNSTPRLKSNVLAAQPSAILTDNQTTDRTSELGIAAPTVITNISTLPASSEHTREGTMSRAEDPAYIIFTSGSTGEPKGVVVKHDSLRVNLEGYHRAWNVASVAEVVLQQTALSFDASLVQIFAALTTGGCLVVAPSEARGDPLEITRLMADHNVTMTQATPSEYDMWFRFAHDNLCRCTSWKAAWFGGERATPSVLKGFRAISEILPGLRVFTSYGPTEATISAMKGTANVSDPTLTVPVPGKLLPNYAAYILDEELKPVPLGVPGEIVIGGPAVGTNKYLHRPDLTAAAFLADSFSAENTPGWGSVYRTGDFGRLDKQGCITVEGRVEGNLQVKLRGFRIELTEIERVMIQESNGALLQAIVTLQGQDEQDQFLAAHVTLQKHYNDDQQAEKVVNRLYHRLPLHLPQYMCPALIIPLNEMPMTVHSKVDRRAVQALQLPELKSSDPARRTDLSPMESRLAKLWTGLLPPRPSTAELQPHTDFFNAGGNSLLLVRLQAAIKREFSDAPRLVKLMGVPELRNMAALIQDHVDAVNWDRELNFDLSATPLAQPKDLQTQSEFCVLVTGATGFLGSRIVRNLILDPRVAKIICCTRLVEEQQVDNILPAGNSKIQKLAADLPTLPSDLESSNIDVVLHCAANRNFWDSYSALKPVNVDTVKELMKFCTRTGAVLHCLSSGAVTSYEGDIDSGTEVLPRPSADDGYAASKWVAERLLSQAARLSGLRVTVHRPTKVVGVGALTENNNEINRILACDILAISRTLGSRPDFTNISGTIDLAPIAEVAAAMSSKIMEDPNPQETTNGQKKIDAIHYPGTARIQIETLGAHAADLANLAENKDFVALPAVPVLHWVGLAKKSRQFEWFFTAQNLIVDDGAGNKIVSRR